MVCCQPPNLLIKIPNIRNVLTCFIPSLLTDNTTRGCSVMSAGRTRVKRHRLPRKTISCPTSVKCCLSGIPTFRGKTTSIKATGKKQGLWVWCRQLFPGIILTITMIKTISDGCGIKVGGRYWDWVGWVSEHLTVPIKVTSIRISEQTKPMVIKNLAICLTPRQNKGQASSTWFEDSFPCL